MSGVEASTRLRTIGKATTLDIGGWVNINRHAFEPYPSGFAGNTASKHRNHWAPVQRPVGMAVATQLV